MLRGRHLIIALILGAGPAPGFAHGTTAGDLPLTPAAVSLRHRRPAEIVALFARADLSAGARLRGARAGSAEALLPPGMDGVLQGSGEVVLVGHQDLQRTAECIQLLDVPVHALPSGLQRTTLTLSRAAGRELKLAVGALRGAGAVRLQRRQLTLEGRPEWIHRALREVIRAELGLDRRPNRSGMNGRRDP